MIIWGSIGGALISALVSRHSGDWEWIAGRCSGRLPDGRCERLCAATWRGLLFDTRKPKIELRAVKLEGAVPSSLIVKATLDFSTDLRRWRTVVSQLPIRAGWAHGECVANVKAASRRGQLFGEMAYSKRAIIAKIQKSIFGYTPS